MNAHAPPPAARSQISPMDLALRRALALSGEVVRRLRDGETRAGLADRFGSAAALESAVKGQKLLLMPKDVSRATDAVGLAPADLDQLIPAAGVRLPCLPEGWLPSLVEPEDAIQARSYLNTLTRRYDVPREDSLCKLLLRIFVPLALNDFDMLARESEGVTHWLQNNCSLLS